jgi:hypothetical protein
MTTVRDINGFPVADEYGTTGASLAGNATWTSVGIPSRNNEGMIRRLVGHVFASAGGSLQYQVSADGSTWRALGSATTVNATTATSFDQVVYAPFSRFVYTNGGSAATVTVTLSPRHL